MFSELNHEYVQMCCILGRHAKTPYMPFRVSERSASPI